MNGLTVLILAAESGAKQTRWAEPTAPKQLIQIQGETLLGRTLRLLAERGVKAPWLLTASEAFCSRCVSPMLTVAVRALRWSVPSGFTRTRETRVSGRSID